MKQKGKRRVPSFYLGGLQVLNMERSSQKKWAAHESVSVTTPPKKVLFGSGRKSAGKELVRRVKGLTREATTRCTVLSPEVGT